MNDDVKQWITELGYEIVMPYIKTSDIIAYFVAEDARCTVETAQYGQYKLRCTRGGKQGVCAWNPANGKIVFEELLRYLLDSLPLNRVTTDEVRVPDLRLPASEEELQEMKAAFNRIFERKEVSE